MQKYCSQEGKRARGQVVHWKHDANSNLIGRFHQNPTLDMCLYEVEFPGREMTELTANIIALIPIIRIIH